MGETIISLVLHGIEAGGVVLAGLWAAFGLRVKLAVLEAKVDLLIKHTGLGNPPEGD